MNPETQARWLAKQTALRAGRIPPGIDPESAEGKRYAVLAEIVKAEMDRAPAMTATQKHVVAVLLRGGTDAAA